MDNILKYDYADEKVEKGDESFENEKISDIDIKKCKFSTYGGDFSIRQLMFMLQENEIEIPKIQRNYVWTTKEASRFIESVLLDLPIPSIFLAKNEEAKFIIVDGLQRLTTLYKYTMEEVNNGKTFKLSTSKDIREEWRGKAFRELSIEDQRRINNKLLHAIIVEQKEPTNFDGLFLIFERINTGGVQLNQQEIRNAIFQYPINEAIHSLNFNKDWRLMFGDDKPHSRMRDEEMILRFLSLYSLNLLDYPKESLNMVQILNKFLENNRNATDEIIDSYKKLFLDCISFIKANFGVDVFRTNIQTHQTTQKFYATVFDSIMLATSYVTKYFNNFPIAKENLEELFSDESFLESCNAHTTQKTAIINRISKACKILYGIDYEK